MGPGKSNQAKYQRFRGLKARVCSSPGMSVSCVSPCMYISPRDHCSPYDTPGIADPTVNASAARVDPEDILEPEVLPEASVDDLKSQEARVSDMPRCWLRIIVRQNIHFF